MTDEFLVFKLIERKAVASLHAVVVLLEVGYDAWGHHQLHIVGREGLLLVLIGIFEVHTHHVAVGDDVSTQIEIEDGDEGCREHVRTEQALEADTSRQHGNDLGIAGQLRGKEDDGDEDEQGREEVGEVGHEIGIVVEDDSL